MNSPVNTLITFDDGQGDALYAGGRFTLAGGVTVGKIAGWDGNVWFSLDGGVGGLAPVVNALAVSGDSANLSLIVGGSFNSAGSIDVNNIAQWDGQTWSALNSGVDASVFALNVLFDPDTQNQDLFVGGSFTTAGEITANKIAGWDGSQWFALGDGFNGSVFALTVFDDGTGMGPSLFAGGDFTMAGDVSVRRLAKWDGMSWSALNNGVSGSVFTLTVFDNGSGSVLVAGGDFTRADGMTVNHIAKWDGMSWSSVGAGTDLTIRSLTVFDDGTGMGEALYAAGTFTTAGGVNAERIAKWNGTTWSALGDGMDNPVFGLTSTQSISSIGPALYAGGSFLNAGGLSTKYIARWMGCFDRPGDFDGDGFTDLIDYQSFESCMSGPFNNTNMMCEPADTDMDGDVDLIDVATLQNFFLPE